MIFLKRKRLIFWLLRAYIKEWGKTISVSFVLGLLFFIVVFSSRSFIFSKIKIANRQSVGIAQIVSRNDLPNSLPDVILRDISRGLTKISDKGEVMPDLADKWEVKDDGKTFIFYLKENVYFSDGTPFNSSSVNYNFEDVVVDRPAKKIIVFKLKDKYSPFLVTLGNRKVFKKKYIGVSNYRISKIKTNGVFVDYIEVTSSKDKKIIKYDFYDTQEALKSAYVLGEVDKILDINNLDYKQRISFISFKNTKITKKINNNKIATVFLNNTDPLLSDKKIRKALAYSLPDSFSEGERMYTPYRDGFWAKNSLEIYQKDIEYSKLLLGESGASKSGSLQIELKTLTPYKSVALSIAKYWKEIGINTKIETVDGVPDYYQAFLGELPVLKDPDQYTLWHTGQAGNITNYRNLRIDKLLEDGRRIYGLEERTKIYSDFQKYLMDDMPAIFLYLPYTYNLSRK